MITILVLTKDKIKINKEMKLIELDLREWDNLPCCKCCGKKLYEKEDEFCDKICKDHFILKHLPPNRHYVMNH